jgi:hypothetical protein
MGRMQASKYSGPGSLSNSSTTAKRRWFTELRTKLAAATNVATFTQGQTLLASIETILIQQFQSFGNGAIAAATRASCQYMPSLSTGNTAGVGTITIKELTKTRNKVTRLHVLLIGPPDPLRSGA